MTAATPEPDALAIRATRMLEGNYAGLAAIP
jgi:hypothetical protein